MVGDKVLVLGGTGPAGICLLRELLYRNHATIAYCRNPDKIPADISGSALLEIIPGELNEPEKLSLTVSKSNSVISLLGPNSFSLPTPTFYAGFYTQTLFPLLIKHRIQSIYAMGTLSIPQPSLDVYNWKREAIVWLVWLVARSAWRNILAVGKAFEEWSGESSVEWTVFRIGGIPGGSSEEVWKREREGKVFAGGIGQPGWTMQIRRSQLANWLVDAAVEGKEGEKWVRKMPSVTALA